LHKVVQEYLAKCRHRGVRSVLENGGIPQGWVVELQFADELDELLMDDLYELNEALRENDELTREERRSVGVGGIERELIGRWFILKPGFADRGQGIRMFSTEEELWVDCQPQRLD
jgi:tubulin--tyrosine ligase